METLIHTLKKFTDIPETSLELFTSKLQEVNLFKGEKLIKAGEICDQLFFVKSGLVRSYYFKEKKDITISFTAPGEFVTSMSSFISQKPSFENIETCDTTQVFRIMRKDLMALFDQDRNIEHLYRTILERYYVALEEQLIFSKFKTSKEKYLELMENKPIIIQKANVGQVASYLDMTLETLSRIRASI